MNRLNRCATSHGVAFLTLTAGILLGWMLGCALVFFTGGFR